MASSPATDFAPLMKAAALHLLGKPSHESAKELRYGRHGSLKVDLEAGTYYDHEAEAGGGVLDLVIRQHGGDKRGAAQWLEREGFIEPHDRNASARPQQPTSIFYDYCDADGAVAYRVERRPSGTPRFLQHGPDGKGGFRSGKGCMEGVQRLPYRLPEILAAATDRTIYVVEGEKDVDRLYKAGLLATTNSEGAGKFRSDIVKYFSGRHVVIIPDNDDTGRAHAADVMAKLSGVAASVITLHLGSVPEKGDVSDWLAMGGSAFDLEHLAEAAASNGQSEPGDFLRLIDPSGWDKLETPAREWAVEDWVPARQATYLSGAGAVGKSLLTQLLCTCAAIGCDFMGVPVAPGVAVYITCEDEEDELHRRQKAICRGLGISLASLKGKLHLVSLVGAIGNELATFTAEGIMSTTPAWKRLRATLISIGAKFIVLDNVAHLFAGNENIRNQVAAFVGLLNSLAQELNAAIVFLGHPNKAGAEFSGSTAWENQVRSRLFLETPTGEDGSDPDMRRLSGGKVNYTQRGKALDFRWLEGTFVRDQDLQPGHQGEIAANVQANAENAAFLRMLAICTRDKQAVSHNRGTNYAPTIFARMPEGKDYRPAAYERAMQRLRHLQQIRYDEPLWRGPNRTMKQGIKLASECTDPPAPTPCTDPHGPPSQVIDNACPDPCAPTPPYIHISGAASRAAAPHREAPLPHRDLSRTMFPAQEDDDDFQAFDQPFGSG